MQFSRFGLLPRVILAIIAGLVLGQYTGPTPVRWCATFNALFGQFLGFSIPLIILGLVTPGIADLGKNGGRLLAVTVALAYASTLFAGFLAYSSCSATFRNCPAAISGG